MVKNKQEIIFEQRNRRGEVCGRLIESGGRVRAESFDDGVWERATPSQAEVIYSQALMVSRMTTGTQVVAWTGRHFTCGSFVGRFCDQFEVSLGMGEKNLMSAWVLPMSSAKVHGLWPFHANMQVAARIDQQWRLARWCGFEDGKHIVVAGDFNTRTDRVLIAADAQSLGVLPD
jgi:hypothetical protein